MAYRDAHTRTVRVAHRLLNHAALRAHRGRFPFH